MTVEGFEREDRDAWKQDFDESSSAGLSCPLCGALVARQPDKVARHVAWHRSMGQAVGNG